MTFKKEKYSTFYFTVGMKHVKVKLYINGLAFVLDSELDGSITKQFILKINSVRQVNATYRSI